MGNFVKLSIENCICLDCNKNGNQFDNPFQLP